ncbi:tudor domain-containing protein 3-like [Actinia tenebrosa]|uniref:Tudor domain-containing protein 3-like n=1 Tax=Actinia tenebrosa TaxID=6105 RepID=A0A6P8HDP0_ACTTE|nr:tudor domain-containing protein 3-like [Actinia tenebrosa]
MEGNLKENGWFLSSEGIAECKKACTKENPTTSECLKAATNLDLKLYGTKFLPEDLHKGKIEFIKGPGVLQIQKLRNVSAPKSNEESTHAPRLLKFYLTDGSMNCQGIEFSTISDISLSTPPGTKICLIGNVPVENGVLLLDNNNIKVLGGEVESLVSKWKLNKSLAKHSRTTANGEDGPPPFVPFNQAKPQESKGNSKGTSVSNGHGMENELNIKQPDRNKPETQHDMYNNNKRGKDRNQEKDGDRHTDTGSRRDDRGDQRGRRGDSWGGGPRGESFRGDRRYNQDKSYGKFSSDSRSSQKDNRGNREYKGGNRNYENSQSGDSRIGDRNNPRRTDHNRTDKAEKPSQSGRTVDNTAHQKTSNMASGNARENGTGESQSRDSKDRQSSDGGSRHSFEGQGNRLGHEGLGRGGQGGRGSSRGGRGGRKDGFGRGRSNSMEQDDSDDYRSRQPSDAGTLWDFVKLTIKTPPKSSTPPPAPKESNNSDTKPDEPKQPSASDSTQEAQLAQENTPNENAESQQTTKSQQQQNDRSENTKQVKPEPPTSQSGKEQKQLTKSNDRSKDGEKHGRNTEQLSTQFRDNRQRQYQQRQQQSSGQGRGRGPRGRHEDGRSYNQSLPPRLQKKQQQQYHQQYHHDRDRKSSIERDSHREKTSSPGSGSSGDGRSSQSPSVESGHSSQSKSSDDIHQRQQQQPRRQKGSQKQQQQSEDYNTSAEQKQSTGPKQGQYDSQMTPSGYISSQPSVQHTHYHVDQQQMYEQQDFNYQQTPPPPPPPPQQYPVYQMPTQMGPPQAVMVTQPITPPSQPHLQTPIPSNQMRWKKGEQCLALRRDRQYYSAKIEHIHPDGQQCMVSFQDFHGGCEMIPTTSLRPFPIITWTDSNAQSLPVATTMTAVPVYAQPAQVAMVPRPQVMVQMQAQPPFPMGPKGHIPNQGPMTPQGLPQPPPGMQWQPAQMNYQDLRQPYPQIIHYDPMGQANNPAARPTYYPVPPGGAMQFVRGVKELHGQELYPHTGNMVEVTADGNKAQPITTVYYNVKSKKTNTRPTQSYYMPPRQQTYGDPSN